MIIDSYWLLYMVIKNSYTIDYVVIVHQCPEAPRSPSDDWQEDRGRLVPFGRQEPKMCISVQAPSPFEWVWVDKVPSFVENKHQWLVEHLFCFMYELLDVLCVFLFVLESFAVEFLVCRFWCRNSPWRTLWPRSLRAVSTKPWRHWAWTHVCLVFFNLKNFWIQLAPGVKLKLIQFMLKVTWLFV